MDSQVQVEFEDEDGSDRAVFRIKSANLVKQLSQLSELEEVDGDDEEDAELIVRENSVKQMDRQMLPPRRMKLSTSIFVPVLVGAIISFALYLTTRNVARVDGISLWLWACLPIIVIICYRICHLVEVGALWIVSSLFPRNWWHRMAVDSIQGYLRFLLTLIVVDVSLFKFWGALETSTPGSSQGAAFQAFINVARLVILICCVALVLRQLIYHSLRFTATLYLYRHAIEDMVFVEDTINIMCSTTSAEREQVRLSKQNDPSRDHFMDRVDLVNSDVLQLPLFQRGGGRGSWIRSESHSVAIHSEKEAAILALIIFENFLDLDSATAELRFAEEWAPLFSAPNDAVRAYRLLFDENAWATQSVSMTQFAAALIKMFQSRTQLNDRLKKFSNTSNLLLKVADIPLFLAAISLVAVALGVNYQTFAISFSAIIISLGFALGPTIESTVTSIRFLFIMQPYEVNDVVEIDNDVYRVHNMSLMQTEFKALTTGKLMTLPHSSVLGNAITNLSRSGTAMLDMSMEVAFTTPTEKLDKLRKSIVKQLQSDRLHWQPKMTIRIESIASCHRMRLHMVVRSTIPWRHLSTFKDLETALMHSIRLKMTRLGIDSPSWPDLSNLPKGPKKL